MWTYSSQSTAIMIVTSSAGKPTVSSTMTIVTRPAWGMPAAPIDAAVAVTLHNTNVVKLYMQKKAALNLPDSHNVTKR